jgi:hypothetical protein
MDIKTPPLYFYLPRQRRNSLELPDRILRGFVDNISGVFFNGPWLSWTLQTYLRLREHDYPCRLVGAIPEEGIVVVHRGDLPFNRKPSADCIFVTTLGDAGWHPYAHVQIVQNPNHLEGRNGTFFMHHWTQPGLIPRNEDRGNAFENVGYFGHPDQLADPLHDNTWAQFLTEHGLIWIPVHKGSDRQSDYSDIDLIVAIRSFDGRAYDYKPATKLHNAWLAGVPAILGPESAYRAERRNEQDYLEARTYDELRDHVVTLKRRPELRQALREQAKANRARIDPAEKARQWWALLTGPILDIYKEWRSRSVLGRAVFFSKRWLHVKRNALQKRLVG